MKRYTLTYACLTAGLLSAVILPSSLRAEDSATPPPPPKEGREGRPELTPEQREERAQKRMDGLAEKLGLDDSQKAQLKTIFDEQKEKMKALEADSSLSREDKMTQMKELMKESKEKIAAILTDEQKAKFEEMKKERGPGGPGGPGGHGKPGGPKGASDKPAPAPPAPTS